GEGKNRSADEHQQDDVRNHRCRGRLDPGNQVIQRDGALAVDGDGQEEEHDADEAVDHESQNDWKRALGFNA
ncbi:hypothetical protein BZG17_28740, partial [Escherichia coli]|nr:hypothetical protein [Escherichia coli]